MTEITPDTVCPIAGKVREIGKLVLTGAGGGAGVGVGTGVGIGVGAAVPLLTVTVTGADTKVSLFVS